MVKASFRSVYVKVANIKCYSHSSMPDILMLTNSAPSYFVDVVLFTFNRPKIIPYLYRNLPKSPVSHLIKRNYRFLYKSIRSRRHNTVRNGTQLNNFLIAKLKTTFLDSMIKTFSFLRISTCAEKLI